jgi:HK97 family phage major capsid protein
MTPEEKKAQEDALLLKIKTQGETQIDAKLVEIKNDFSELIGQAKTGLITEEGFTEGLAPIEEKLKDFDPEIFKSYRTELDKYKGMVDSQGTELAKLKEGGLPANVNKADALWAEVLEHVKSPEFDQFVKNPKQSVSFALKTVSITDDYTGNVFISAQDSRVVDYPEVTRLNIRDLLRVNPIDFPLLTFLTVTDWVRAVGVVSENGILPESAFKEVEESTDVKRIGTFLSLSKRILRRPKFIVDHLRQRLPAQVRYYEDFQLLWGDGAGNNLTGIFNVADDFATIVNATKITGIAGDVTSIATYNGGTQTLVNFTANQDTLFNGDVITFAATTAGTYDNSYSAIVISPTQILIEQAYTADVNVLANWTFTVNNAFKDSIAAAQQIDVLKVASSIINVQQYRNTGFVLNPTDATKIETLKGNDEHYIDVNRLENGVLTIAGVPVIETTAMPAGKFACGDWSMAAALFQYTDLTLEFAESVDQKLNNTVVAIIQEEVLFPIYNKYMFLTGDFTTAIAAIGV